MSVYVCLYGWIDGWMDVPESQYRVNATNTSKPSQRPLVPLFCTQYSENGKTKRADFFLFFYSLGR